MRTLFVVLLAWTPACSDRHVETETGWVAEHEEPVDGQLVPFEQDTPGGRASGFGVFATDHLVVDGDILVPYDATRSAHRTDAAARWPGCVVPFVMDPLLPAQVVSDLQTAMNDVAGATLVSFQQRTNEQDWIHFVLTTDPAICGSSAVGLQHTGAQDLYVNAGCPVGTYVHEIGHALGLWHEHMRADRDTFVAVQQGNIDPQYLANFDTYVTAGQDGVDDGPYDFGSVMHYSSNAFILPGLTCTRTDTAGCSMVRAADGSYIAAQRVGLSPGDIAGIDAMYTPECGCPDSDGDGFGSCDDCDDEDAARHPGAAETCDGVDDDCDGLLGDGCDTVHAVQPAIDLLLAPLETPYLSAATPGVAGTVDRLSFEGLEPGASTFLVAGAAPGATPLPGCPGIQVQIGAPRAVVASATAGSDGSGRFDVAVPAGASGRTVRLQAVQPSTCTLSQVRAWTIP